MRRPSASPTPLDARGRCHGRRHRAAVAGIGGITGPARGAARDVGALTSGRSWRYRRRTALFGGRDASWRRSRQSEGAGSRPRRAAARRSRANLDGGTQTCRPSDPVSISRRRRLSSLLTQLRAVSSSSAALPPPIRRGCRRRKVNYRTAPAPHRPFLQRFSPLRVDGRPPPHRVD